jgi:NadR type nicotinamide-nucleotide adenylyltransferase
MWKTGVTIGKFMPPHRGHKFLIETALAQVEHLTVIVCEKKDDHIPGALRAAWLREIHPTAQVLLIDDYYDDDDDSSLWARLVIGWLGGVPDVAFTSENYGDTWAQEMGCQHVKVDLERANVPIGARFIRADPWAHWQWLEPPLRAYYARRIVVLGAESSGSTTLALHLAAHFNTVWVPEYGRDYCAERGIFDNYAWETGEFEHIAREQIRRENALAREANRILVCDTDAFATRLWHWRYFGHYSPRVDAIAFEHRRPDLYLLTDIDIPFVQDGLRDGEAIRHEMHREFVAQLEKQPVPWRLLSGSRQTRLREALEAIETAASKKSALE